MSDKTDILTVSELTLSIKRCLEAKFPNVYVQGEISNAKLQSSGHLYFSLKDTHAQISCVMFRFDAAKLMRPIKDGDHVVVKGEINVYPVSGKYQIIVRELKHAGLGELLLKLEELKKKIHQRGWFNKEHKKPLPKMPSKIGVITSPTGAAIRDILHVLTRRFSGLHIMINPVKVQGEGAKEEIAQAIDEMNEYKLADVIILGRGGGSIEDLWAFNEELVASAIFKSEIPIISAVGHETDHTIAEYVADMRAPTPSAAAEIVIEEKQHYRKQLKTLSERIDIALKNYKSRLNQQIDGLIKHPILRSPYTLIGMWVQKLDGMKESIDLKIRSLVSEKKAHVISQDKQLKALKPTQVIQHTRQKIKDLEKHIDHALNSKLEAKKQDIFSINIKCNHLGKNAVKSAKVKFSAKDKLDRLNVAWESRLSKAQSSFYHLVETLKAIDPKKLLSRGYSILFSEKSGSVIKSIRELKREKVFRIMLQDGEANAELINTKSKEPL